MLPSLPLPLHPFWWTLLSELPLERWHTQVAYERRYEIGVPPLRLCQWLACSLMAGLRSLRRMESLLAGYANLEQVKEVWVPANGLSNADSNGNDYTFRGGPEHKTSIPFSFSALEHGYNPLEFNSRKNNANMWQIKHRNFTFLGDVFVAVSILLMVAFKLLICLGGGGELGAVCCLIMKHNKRHTGN